jgi:4-hydroxy-3-polyprenylbenzoate decarboxylase
MRLIIGISGASGAIYGVRLLETLQEEDDVETHLVMSSTGRMNIQIETDWKIKDVESLADVVHRNNDVGAMIASGSFQSDGMIVAPCSMKTLSAIVNSYADNLLCRAADVMLKERKQLILVPRESPLHSGHCRLLYPCLLSITDRSQSTISSITQLAGYWTSSGWNRDWLSAGVA